MRRPVTHERRKAVAALEHQPATPRDHASDWSPSELRRVVVRLVGDDLVQAGTAPNRDSAIVLARSVIAEIDTPSGDWPMIGNRILRPDSVLSVDLVRAG
jgi:hypothetical protein